MYSVVKQSTSLIGTYKIESYSCYSSSIYDEIHSLKKTLYTLNKWRGVMVVFGFDTLSKS